VNDDLAAARAIVEAICGGRLSLGLGGVKAGSVLCALRLIGPLSTRPLYDVPALTI
jgi:hypothetical protein